MTPELRELIEESREILEADQPSNMGWAYLRPPAEEDALSEEFPPSVRDLLRVSDGILAGYFDMPSAGQLADFQSDLEGAPEFTGIPDDPGRWFVFAVLVDEPLFINRESGSVWLFPWTGDEWYMRNEFFEIAPDLDSFMRYYVFGPGYAEIGSDDDEWYAFLGEQGLLEESEEDDDDEEGDEEEARQ